MCLFLSALYFPPSLKSATSKSSDGDDDDADRVSDATGHAALCISEELWTLSGIDGVSSLVMSLSKVLASLPLPEDDQVCVCVCMCVYVYVHAPTDCCARVLFTTDTLMCDDIYGYCIYSSL